MKKLLIFLAITIYSFANSVDEQFLEPQDAFQVEFIQNEDSLNIKLSLGKDIYLYDDKLQINITKPKKIELLNDISLPKPVEYKGFIVHFDNLDLFIPYSLLKEKINLDKYEIEFKFQGCTKSGVCYAPMSEKKVISFDGTTQNEVKEDIIDENISEIDIIANSLKNSNTFIVLATFFGFGLLLSFTPCVFPMIPILSSIIVKASQNEKIGAKKGFFLSLVYVLSMSLAYTIAGVIAGIFGANLQASLQNPYILVAFSFIFVLLAFSMFGYFELKLPTVLQNKINHLSKGKDKQGVLGIAILGFLSALIVGPCVAPPLAGALIYIGQTGDAVLGALALFFMSLGMGIPLLLIGLGAGKFMPKPSVWMEGITKIFGIVMLGVAIWFLSRVINLTIIMYLWAILFLGTGIYLKIYMHIFLKLISMIVTLIGVILFVAAVSGATNILKPFEKFTNNMDESSTQTLNFIKVKNLAQLEYEIQKSSKPVILDFWATWCVSCKELDEITFKDKEVIQKLQNFTLLKVDVTQNSANDKAIQKKFGIVGPPALIFWDKNKQEVRSARIVGYKNPQDFLRIINKNFPQNF